MVVRGLLPPEVPFDGTVTSGQNSLAKNYDFSRQILDIFLDKILKR
jgi:hypothetical protein